jgi:hypothetical protein
VKHQPAGEQHQNGFGVAQHLRHNNNAAAAVAANTCKHYAKQETAL